MSMDIDGKIFYNEGSAAKFGWSPDWFGCDEFDEKLVQSIAEWQAENGLTADGLLGPTTYRHLFTYRESLLTELENEQPFTHGHSHVVYNNDFYPIKWDKMVHWYDEGGLKARKGTYSDYTGKQPRRSKMFVNHWDVCLSSRSCQRVLDKRGISVHFLIDNDGTIYQTTDMQNATWHAGSRQWNHSSIGVEIANAYDPKYQSWYVKKGFGERPIVRGAECHGQVLAPFLGFYDVQIEALKALWVAVHTATGIPLQSPVLDDKLITTVHAPSISGDFHGFVNHYNLKRTKIDCAGLDIHTLLQDAKRELL